MTKGALARSLGLLQPERKIAVLSSSITVFKNSLTAPGPLTASFSTGKAMAAISAPRARHLATSKPVLTPPEAITSRPVEQATSRMLAAVGIPQSQKTSPSLALSPSLASRAL